MSLSLSSAIVAAFFFIQMMVNWKEKKLSPDPMVAEVKSALQKMYPKEREIPLELQKLPSYTEKQLLSSYIDCDCDRGDQGVSMAEILHIVFNVIASSEINVEGEKMCLSTHDPTGNANIV